ncbi:MAG: nickel pincer cofactor biosynthesis protein LarB [Thermoleophilia bacterium]|nr:nickel pincer cofactor biosynthesis protein LarB [Thermoleophilia bacterium]
MSEETGYDRDLRRLLESIRTGDIDVDGALRKLRLFQIAQVGEFARLDINRDLRKGVPEVIYASRKSDADLEAIVRRCLDERGFALATRLEPQRAARLRQALTGEPAPEAAPASQVAQAALVFAYQENTGALAVHMPSYRPPEPRGCVGVLTAGTSDIPVAEEAILVITHMGCRVERGYDAGVSGLHRLAEPLTRMLEAGADALIVVAGMEGALPSVVAGLVDVPVIGVPTSTGYGLGGDGTAALLSMLQSCSPGLVTVNIDNGVGAGAAAALIARGRPA